MGRRAYVEEDDNGTEEDQEAVKIEAANTTRRNILSLIVGIIVVILAGIILYFIPNRPVYDVIAKVFPSLIEQAANFGAEKTTEKSTKKI